ncbi:MAG: GntR family transcriptional regulator [Chloroflexota bacterium]|nr:GntR family transcriptional regulator [Chloroflexota bacterium]
MAVDNIAGRRSATRYVLREDIKEHLIDAILRGRYKPGDRLAEAKLAKEFGVSQSPIREALRDLEMMGFVESVPFSGSFVRDLSLKEMLDTYAVRAWMEAMAGRLATPNLTEELFARLEMLLERMMKQAQRDDSHEFAKADFAFHQTIVAAAGNSTLIRLYDMLQFAYWTYASTILTDYNLVYQARRHYKILDALNTGDPDLIAKTLQDHIEELIDRITAHYSERQAEADIESRA